MVVLKLLYTKQRGYDTCRVAVIPYEYEHQRRRVEQRCFRPSTRLLGATPRKDARRPALERRPRVNKDDPSGSFRRGTRIGPQTEMRCHGRLRTAPGPPSPGGHVRKSIPISPRRLRHGGKRGGDPVGDATLPGHPPPTHLTLRLCAIAIRAQSGKPRGGQSWRRRPLSRLATGDGPIRGPWRRKSIRSNRCSRAPRAVVARYVF